MVRPYLAVIAAVLLARTLWPPVLPALVCLLGLRFGGTPGANCGLLGGILALFLGVSPFLLPIRSMRPKRWIIRTGFQ